MSDRTDFEFVRDIDEAVRRISSYTSCLTYEAFLADIKTQDAIIRNLEIIGEAAKNLSPELRTQHFGYSLEKYGWRSRSVNP